MNCSPELFYWVILHQEIQTPEFSQLTIFTQTLRIAESICALKKSSWWILKTYFSNQGDFSDGVSFLWMDSLYFNPAQCGSPSVDIYVLWPSAVRIVRQRDMFNVLHSLYIASMRSYTWVFYNHGLFVWTISSKSTVPAAGTIQHCFQDSCFPFKSFTVPAQLLSFCRLYWKVCRLWQICIQWGSFNIPQKIYALGHFLKFLLLLFESCIPVHNPMIFVFRCEKWKSRPVFERPHLHFFAIYSSLLGCTW